ncbi:MAG: DNA-directed RNA polymerase subunit omega [Puniceicoccales bacterium]|nr:DNA-directed RNA polymerase subunit omega [Puniceicoccales bacterium]
MRDDYLKLAQERVDDPRILVNLISQRVRQLRFGARPLVETLERLDPEDLALREIMAGKISYELPGAVSSSPEES